MPPGKGLAIYELAHDSITTRGEDPYVWSTQLLYHGIHGIRIVADSLVEDKFLHIE